MHIRYACGFLIVMAGLLKGADDKSPSNSLGDSPSVIPADLLLPLSASAMGLSKPLPRSQSAESLSTPQTPDEIPIATESGSQPPTRTLTPPPRMRVIYGPDVTNPFLSNTSSTAAHLPTWSSACSVSTSACAACNGAAPYDSAEDSDSDVDDPQIFHNLNQATGNLATAHGNINKKLIKLWDMVELHKGDLRSFYANSSAATSNAASALPSAASSASNSMNFSLSGSAAAHVALPSSAVASEWYPHLANAARSFMAERRRLLRSSAVQAVPVPTPSVQPLIDEMVSIINSATATNAKVDAAAHKATSAAQDIATRSQTSLNAAQQSIDATSTALSGGGGGSANSPAVLSGSEASKDGVEIPSNSDRLVSTKAPARVKKCERYPKNNSNTTSKITLALAAAAGSVATLAWQERKKIANIAASKCVIQ